MNRRREDDGGPGRIWVALLRAMIPSEQRESALGDVLEEFAQRSEREGVRDSRAWMRRQAIRSIGPGLRHRATIRRVRARHEPGEGMSMWGSDLKLAIRNLARRPGFTATIVVTLALGMGATTTIFGVFRSVFLAPLPLPDSEELVVVMQTAGFGCCGPASGPDYVDWVERERSFEGLAMLSPGSMTLTGLDQPERIYGTRVTANAFDFLGVAPLLGRGLQEPDAVSGDAVVLNHTLWSRIFGARPDVVGSSLEIDGRPVTIVGVMPEDFDVPSPWLGTRNHELYLPVPPETFEESRGSHSYPVVARLADGVTVESAQSDMDRIMRELAEEYPQTNAARGAEVFTVHEYLYGDAGEQLGLILAAAALVLLIACANVAGLQLARAAGRESELSVRTALGASRRAVVRLLFSESLILAATGGLLGIVVARVSVEAVKGLLPPGMPRVEEIGIDATVLAFAGGATLLTALVFGMLPAFLSSRSDLASGVREGGRGTLAPGKERVRDLFIVGQIGLGLVLVNGAGLLVRSYTNVRTQEYGFETEGVLTLALNPGGPRYEEAPARERFFQQVGDAVEQVPGVTAVGMVSRLPLAGGSNGTVQVEGWEPRTGYDEGPLVEVTSVVDDYFEAMGIPLLQGRLHLPDDSIEGAVGVVVNQAMVDEVWPGEDPIGKRFAFGDPPPWLTVVGVVGNVRQWGPEQDVLAQAYFPYVRGWSGSGFLTVRLEGDPTVIVPEIRRAVLSVDPTQPPSDIRTMDDRLRARFAQRRFYTTLIALFAVAALFLASAGVYGTVSYFVARRTRELGIRMALGAPGAGIVGLVVRRGIRLAAWGLALGLLGVWATVSLARTLVYGIGPVDVLSLVLGCVVLTAVAVGASAIPAGRAASIRPNLALRSE